MVMGTKDRNHYFILWWQWGRLRSSYWCGRWGTNVIILIDIVHNVVILIVSANDIRNLIDWNDFYCCLFGSSAFLGPWFS